jgi:RNA exonuclease NGL2
MLSLALENAGFSHFYAAAPGKRHGCLVAFNNRLYKKLEERIVVYDEQEVAPGRLGSSIRTRNIGVLIALERNDGRGGAIIATTHLFWQPKSVSCYHGLPQKTSQSRQIYL